MGQSTTPEAAPAPPHFRGVLGGGCAHPRKANLRLIRRAINEGWDIPEAKRLALIEHLCGVVTAGHTRNMFAAVRCLLAAERVNLRERKRRGASNFP